MNLRRFYAVNQAEYCRNFIFKRHFPIHKIFERSSEIGLWRMTASKISEVFGQRMTRKFKGKLNTTLEQIEHLRVYSHYGPMTRNHPEGGFVDRLQEFSFLPPCYPSYEASDFASVGLILPLNMPAFAGRTAIREVLHLPAQ